MTALASAGAMKSPGTSIIANEIQYIQSKNPDVRLAYKRQEGSSPGIFFLPGFGSHMEGEKAQALAKHAEEMQCEMVRFDYRGHGKSEGVFEDCSLQEWIDDALTIIDEVSKGPMVVVGSSMGGWIGLHVAIQRPQKVCAFIGIAIAADFIERRWATMSSQDKENIMQKGSSSLNTKYENFKYVFTRRLVEGSKGLNLLDNDELLSITCPVRLLHGTMDDAVPWSISAQVLEKLSSADATLTLIKGGDHRLAAPAELDRLKHTVQDVRKLCSGLV